MRHIGKSVAAMTNTMAKTVITFAMILLVYTTTVSVTTTSYAKPVPLTDYNAQTFFENYELICRNYAPLLDNALTDSSLTYQGETSLYRKYAFRTNGNVLISIYENKAGYVSLVEIKRHMRIDATEDKEMHAQAVICLEYLLDLDPLERRYLNKLEKRSPVLAGELFQAEGVGRTYSQINNRWIHVNVKLTSLTHKGQKDTIMCALFSADDSG